MKIETYDTTLRDGAQGEGISFSPADQLLVVEALDDLGIMFIEGGQPGSNPKARDFFTRVRKLKLKQTRITAFGSTRNSRTTPGRDPMLKDLLRAETGVVTIVGKSWDFHVDKVLRTSLAENLRMIEDTIAYCVKRDRMVIYDAEHFFDGYRANPEFALKTLEAAAAGGAERLVLCDTNGGSLPWEVGEIVETVRACVETPIGIHVHDDSDLSTANSVMAIRHGAVHVQGTINGIGERCGNADLTAIIPTLQLKLKKKVVTARQLKNLTRTSRLVAELANQVPKDGQAYVGHSAFAHKGGWHTHAVQRDARTYEHIEPEVVGNQRRILVSELSGRHNILAKAKEVGVDLAADTPDTRKILQRVKDLEAEGYHFEGAEASFELLIAKAQGTYVPFYELLGFRVIVEKRESGDPFAEATVRLRVGDQEIHTAAEGNGPVNALDTCLRKALEGPYPVLKEMHLVDYKVRVIDAKSGTGAKTRVHIESADRTDAWNTVGVHENLIEASYEALVDSIEYKLRKAEKRRRVRRAKAARRSAA